MSCLSVQSTQRVPSSVLASSTLVTKHPDRLRKQCAGFLVCCFALCALQRAVPFLGFMKLVTAFPTLFINWDSQTHLREWASGLVWLLPLFSILLLIFVCCLFSSIWLTVTIHGPSWFGAHLRGRAWPGMFSDGSAFASQVLRSPFPTALN